MNIIDFITSKKNGSPHKKEEIGSFIESVMDGSIPDYQVSAWLMAVNFNSLNTEETIALTKAIVESGDVSHHENLPGPVVDKHSTGGVGDKITLVLLPILSEMGMFAPKHSGRALGFTGGTIDKLESIPGFNAYLPEKEFTEIVRSTGFGVGGQTKDICPADGILYALRDATATVDDVGLIAASIVSKKIAAGADSILLDVKVGKGAFMKSAEDAEFLAHRMIEVGEALGKKIRCILTRMDQPLGKSIGNALEVDETIACLRGEGPTDVMDICKAASVELATMSGLMDHESASGEFEKIVSSGSALERFIKFVRAQRGDTGWIEKREPLMPARNIVSVQYKGQSMFVSELNALKIGEMVRLMGGGRMTKEEDIDHSVGVVLNLKIGDPVRDGDILGWMHIAEGDDADIRTEEFLEAFSYEPVQPQPVETVIETI